MFRRLAACALPLVLSQALAGAAAADPQLDGRWTVDKGASLGTMAAPGTMKPAEIQQLLQVFGAMTMEFTGSKAVVGLNGLAVTCDWAWASRPRITLSKCLDKQQQPAPSGLDHLELASDGSLRAYQSDGSALSFRKG